MKLRLYQKFLLLLLIPLTIIIITNPSYEDFKSYTGHDINDSSNITRDRTYFIYSTYTVSFNSPNIDYHFVGILGNFYELRKKDPNK